MKKVLVIGSAVADVIIDLEDHLPRTGEDIHVRSQKIRLGGCGFNTYDILRHFHVPSIPFFPTGRGAYGDFVLSSLAERGIFSPIPRPDEENGCCYCFIEPDGERTFISYHGAEYRFRKEWFELLCTEDIHSVYFCGLEIEEATGGFVAKISYKLNGVQYADDDSRNPLYLAVALTQDSILGPQAGGLMGDEYPHNHVLRAAVNGAWGEAVTFDANESKTQTYQQAVDATWNPSHLSIVAFVYNDNGVEQAIRKVLR